MTTVVLECKDCGSILVVNAKDLWSHIGCVRCGSRNVVNLDEVLEVENVEHDR